MTDETDPKTETDDDAPEAAPAGEAPTDEAPDAAEAEETAPAGEVDQDRVIELEAKVSELEDKWKRAMAETVNVQQRAERAKQDAMKYGAAGFAKEMVNVADNLRRALDAIDEGARKADESLENLWTGVEMTEREMLNAFERLGVKRIDAEGHPMNPHFHDAMMEMENPDVPAGTVVQVVQNGYVLHDRLLRPAKVIVAKGGPKAAAGDGQADEDGKSKDKAGAYDKGPDAKGGTLDEEL